MTTPAPECAHQRDAEQERESKREGRTNKHTRTHGVNVMPILRLYIADDVPPHRLPRHVLVNKHINARLRVRAWMPTPPVPSGTSSSIVFSHTHIV